MSAKIVSTTVTVSYPTLEPLLSVECAPFVLEQIRIAAMDSFFALPHGGLEIGGALFGRFEEGRLRILMFRPLRCEHALGPSFNLSAADHERLAALLQEVDTDQQLAGLAPVGWYHSHTRSDIYPTEADAAIHQRYFSESWQVALVVRPDPRSTMRAGLFVHAPDEPGMTAWREFTLEDGLSDPVLAATPLPKPVAAPLPVQKAAPAPAPAPVAAPEAAAPVAPAARIEPVRRRAWWIWLALLLCFAGGGAAGLLIRDYLARPQTQPVRVDNLGLQAMEAAGRLQIRWNPAVQAVRESPGGMLAINEGNTRTVIPLDAEKLRAGSYPYERHSEIVDVRLSVTRADGSRMVEFTSFIGPAPLPAEVKPEAPPVAEARPAPVPEVKPEAPPPEVKARPTFEVVTPPVRPTRPLVLPPARRANAPVNTPAPPPPVISGGGAAPVAGLPLAVNHPPAPPVKAPEPAPAKPAAAAPAPPHPKPVPAEFFLGRWYYPLGSGSGSPFEPEAAGLTLSYDKGLVQGSFTGRYRTSKESGMNPRVSFRFAGKLLYGPMRFQWTGPDGTAGTIELNPLVGRNALEVVWYPSSKKYVFDDIFVKTR